MQALTIDAVSLESAHGIRAALREFETELVETERGGYQVKVALTGSDRAIVLVLRALENYVTKRANGPVKVILEGRAHTMRPRPETRERAVNRASASV